jgi:hypothetical protein
MAITSTAITTVGNQITPVIDIGQEHAATCLMFCNISSSNAMLTVRYVKNGGNTTTDPNTVIYNLIIPHGETFSFDSEKIILEEGDYIFAKSSGNDQLVVTASTLRVK